MKGFDVAVVGAGIVGAACAAALSGEGLSVVVIDGQPPAGGTTASGMGHIVAMDDSPAQLALTTYSQRLWRELAADLPADCEYEKCGTIWVAANDEEMTEVRRKYELYTSQGQRSTILDADQLRQAEPNLREGLVGGLLVDDDMVVYQMAVTRHLLSRAAGRHAKFRMGTPVSSIEDSQVVLTDGERISAGIIVNAAGPGASSLSPGLTIRPRKGHLIITDGYPGYVRHQLVELGYLRSAHGAETSSVAFNVQPRKTDQLLVGSSRQFDVDHDRVDPVMVRRMAARAFEYMPTLRKLSALRVWTGFRPATPDNLPYIGRITTKGNTYAAAGHEGLGITTSLGTAAILADMVTGRPTAIDAAPYSPDRLTRH